MYAKILGGVVAVLLVNQLSACPAQAQSRSVKDLQRIEKIKAKVAKLSSEPNAKVIVTLDDDTTEEGYITSFEGSRFALTDAKSGLVTPLSFVEVRDVHKKSSPAKIAAIIALTAGAGTGILYLAAFGLSRCARCME